MVFGSPIASVNEKVEIRNLESQLQMQSSTGCWIMKGIIVMI